ncbi:MAG: hypothetical protein PVG75_01595 [Thioalkalispiraceae bacterium]|jgi:hypothetical protein
MPELICPFSAPLVKKDFSCQYAKEIIRRGGAEIACKKIEMHERCCTLHAKIKQPALHALDYNDDLLEVPHNMLIKIQYGGLLGLQDLHSPQSVEAERIPDIASLVNQVAEKFQQFENLPYDQLNQRIIGFKTQRRSRR